MKIGVLKNFTQFTVKHLCQSLFLKKVQAKAGNFIKNETLAQMFFCEFCEIFKNTFFTEHLRQLVLYLLNDTELGQSFPKMHANYRKLLHYQTLLLCYFCININTFPHGGFMIHYDIHVVVSGIVISLTLVSCKTDHIYTFPEFICRHHMPHENKAILSKL